MTESVDVLSEVTDITRAILVRLVYWPFALLLVHRLDASFVSLSQSRFMKSYMEFVSV